MDVLSGFRYIHKSLQWASLFVVLGVVGCDSHPNVQGSSGGDGGSAGSQTTIQGGSGGSGTMSVTGGTSDGGLTIVWPHGGSTTGAGGFGGVGGDGGSTITMTVTETAIVPDNDTYLWFKKNRVDVELRALAMANDPYWIDFKAVADDLLDGVVSGYMPQTDTGACGGIIWESSEEWCLGLALASHLEPDPVQAQQYRDAARALFHYVVSQAAMGNDPNQPFQCHAGGDRLQFFEPLMSVSFTLLRDGLSSQDKLDFRTDAFLKIDSLNAKQDSYAPDPNDPTALTPWGSNNYWGTYSMTQIYAALALLTEDPNDVEAQAVLEHAVSIWLYVTYNVVNDWAAPGNWREGWEYFASGYGSLMQNWLALNVTGRNDIVTLGPQVDPTDNIFFADFQVPHLFARGPGYGPNPDFSWYGPLPQPSTLGDLENYPGRAHVKYQGPLAELAHLRADDGMRNFARWIMWDDFSRTDAGIHSAMLQVPSGRSARDLVFMFAAFAGQPAPMDPRKDLPTAWLQTSLNGAVFDLFAVTDWQNTKNASFFTFRGSDAHTDHQTPAAGRFELSRKNVPLTTVWPGYGITARSTAYGNGMCIERAGAPVSDGLSSLKNEVFLGAQIWADQDGPPVLVAASVTQAYQYASVDLTDTYNTTQYGYTDVLHQSRSVFYQQVSGKDRLLVFDRSTANHPSKRTFWFNQPVQPQWQGRVATLQMDGQKLITTVVEPADAVVGTDNSEPNDIGEFWGQSAAGGFMSSRGFAKNNVAVPATEFLVVMQGMDDAESGDVVQLIISETGSFTGARVGSYAVLFSKDLYTVNLPMTVVLPSATLVYVTGLEQSATYSVVFNQGKAVLTADPNGPIPSDGGGVLSFIMP